MTTDPFTEAARAYAEQACYQDENIPIAEAGFRAGWKAARTHLAVEVRKAKAEALTKRWVCQVARSGYHNGASCRPDDAHSDWGCDYYYEASIRATEYETGASDEHR